MDNNLVQQVRSYFSDEVISSLSLRINESHEQTKKGVDVAIPSLLLGFQSHKGDGLDSILNQARHLFAGFQVGNVFGNFFGSGNGTDDSRFESQNLLSSVFGEKLPGVVTTTAGLVGIKEESMRNILGATLPAVISVVTHKGSMWDATEVGHFLDGHKNEIAVALPVGLGLGTFGSSFAQAERPAEIDLPRPEANPQTDEPPVVHTEQTVKAHRRSGGIWWILIPLFILFLWYFFGRGCSRENTIIDNRDTTSAIP